jgi:hypothetical protein
MVDVTSLATPIEPSSHIRSQSDSITVKTVLERREDSVAHNDDESELRDFEQHWSESFSDP